jgi:flagellar biosynthesis protein FlhG
MKPRLAKDYMLDQAQKLRELVSVERRRRLGERIRHTRRIVVTSGKGGVGKSNFSLNFAILTARLGKKVLLIDADTNLANIDILLGISPKYNLSHVVAGIKSPQDILLAGPAGITLLPAASGNIEQVLNEGVASEAVIADLNSLEGNFDLVVMDTGAGASRVVLDFVLSADTMVLLTTLEPTAITDAYAVVKLVSSERADLDIQILVNLVRNKREAVEVYEKLASVINHFLKIDVQYLGYLPRDTVVERAVHVQEPFVNAFPKAPISVQMKFISRKLMQLGELPVNEIGGIFSGLWRLAQEKNAVKTNSK